MLYFVIEIGSLPRQCPTLIVRQWVSAILEIREPQHGLPCFASHARISARLGKGVTSSPVASPRAGGSSHFPSPPPPPRRPPEPPNRAIPPAPSPWTYPR